MTIPYRTADAAEGGEFGFLDLATVLLRHRRRLIVWPLLGAFAAVAIALLLPRSYLAEASFTPQSGNRSSSALSGLAAQFGVVVPSGDASDSPDFYAGLVRMPSLLRAAVESTYHFDRGGTPFTGDLVAAFDIDPDTRPRQVAQAMDRLDDQLIVSTDASTGIVKLDVRAKWPELSAQVVQRLLDLVNDFNLRSRQSQAAQERRFVETRLRGARTEQAAAEDSLQAFLQRNRDFSSSPQLMFQHDRLQRSVSMRQDIASSLAQSFERSRIDEVRNTAVITIVDPPEIPARAEPRRMLLKTILGLVLGFILAASGAFIGEFYRSASRTEGSKVAEFEAAAAALRADFRRLRSRARGRSAAPPDRSATG